ncbi:MAG: SMP-30/gluconolactonase/LRE family protein [Bacteroidota bacterium]
MLHRLAVGLVTLILLGCSREVPFVATDLTDENRFTNNIEGPAWRDGYLYVVNFEKDGTISRVNADGEPELLAELPAGSTANSIRFNSEGKMMLADFTGHNVLNLDPVDGTVSVLAHDTAFNQPNDLAINRRDQVFATDPDWKNGTGNLWRIDPDGSTHLLADSLGTTNGIAFSPDERMLYVAESVQRIIWVYDVDDAGEISGKRKFAEFTDYGLDGMKCDDEGNLFATRYGKGTIAMLAPDGTLLREIRMKGKNTSNLTFGGPDGRTCFVTLQDRGCVETFRVEVPGSR